VIEKGSAQGAAKGKAAKPQVAFQDLWDWAYCPLRVWWRKNGLARNANDGAGKRTGEQLMRRAVETALQAHYRLRRKGKRRGVQPVGALGLVWRSWLDGWGFDRAMARDLVEYHEGRRAILRRFEEGGDIRRPDGTLYRRPMWTRWWRELATSSGLLQLRQHIDGQGARAGLPTMDLSEDELHQEPMGLADAFATSFDILEGQKDLPTPEKVLAVNAPLSVELLSVRLLCQAALIVDMGEAPARGRPPKGSDGPRMKRKLGYELHIFDRDLPSPYVLARDLRVLALGLALPDALDLDGQDVVVDAVLVRHMHSGEVQSFRPDLSDGADLLESLARAVKAGIRAGAYVPRMVCGWTACGDCEYRSLCFADSGVMAAFNPPMIEQIRASKRMYEQVSKFIEEGESWKHGTAALQEFLKWMAETPGLSPEGALWLIDAVEAGRS